jgi:sigma-E factor negative regulatory protein RseA
MQEELNSKISEFVDHESSVEDALILLDSANDFPELEKKLYRYRTVSQVLKTDTFIYSDFEFVNRVKSEVQHEPIYLLPGKQRKSRSFQILSALAASFMAMAIFIYGGMTKSIEDKVPLLQITANTPVQHGEPDRGVLQKIPNDKFNDYLEAHRGSLYMAGSPGYQSYVRLADYEQE